MEEGREVHIAAVLAEGYQRSRGDAQGSEKSCVAWGKPLSSSLKARWWISRYGCDPAIGERPTEVLCHRPHPTPPPLHSRPCGHGCL